MLDEHHPTCTVKKQSDFAKSRGQYRSPTKNRKNRLCHPAISSATAHRNETFWWHWRNTACTLLLRRSFWQSDELMKWISSIVSISLAFCCWPFFLLDLAIFSRFIVESSEILCLRNLSLYGIKYNLVIDILMSERRRIRTRHIWNIVFKVLYLIDYSETKKYPCISFWW